MIGSAQFPKLDSKLMRLLMVRMPKRALTLVLAGFRTVKFNRAANFWLSKSKSDPKNGVVHFTLISRVNMAFHE